MTFPEPGSLRERSLTGQVLITGGTGLIGRHVLDQWDVPDLTPTVLEHSQHDLLVPGVAASLVRHLRPAAVLHLAWVASGDFGYRVSDDNARWVRTSMELADVCREVGSHLYLTGTALDNSDEATDAYSAAKVALWRQLCPAAQAGQLTWLRPFYVFDPERRRPAVVDSAMTAIADGSPLVLRTPESLHDYVHAADVGAAIVLALKHGLTGEVSIGSGRLRRVRELVAALGASWTADAPTGHSNPQRHDAADIARLSELGWSAAHTEKVFAS